MPPHVMFTIGFVTTSVNLKHRSVQQRQLPKLARKVSHFYGSSVAYTLSKDTRDSRFDPTEGYFLELDETVSGLGGDVKFLRTKLSAAYYKPLLF